MDLQTLLNIFKDLALSEKEQIVTRTLAKHGSMTIPRLMESTKLTKATVYRLFRGLQEKGLVSSDHKRYNQTVMLCSPRQLLNYASRKQRTIRKIELKIKDNLTSIQTLLKNPVSLPEVQKFYGKEGYLEITEETVETPNSEILYFGDLDDIHRVITKEYDYRVYMLERIKKNIFLRMLVGKTREMLRVKIEDEKCLRETRFIHDQKLLSASFLISGENVYFLSHSDEAVAVKISSVSISSMFRTIFEHYWLLVSPA